MHRFLLVLLLALTAASPSAQAQAAWLVRTNGAAGPLAQVALPDFQGRKRTAFVALEYARQCDPLFSFTEISGERLGTPVSQELLQGSRIGVLLNGRFFTWHAARTTYTNGYEAAMGVPNELALQLLVNVDTLTFVTPSGERVPLPVANFSQAFQAAIEACRRKVR